MASREELEKDIEEMKDKVDLVGLLRKLTETRKNLAMVKIAQVKQSTREWKEKAKGWGEINKNNKEEKEKIESEYKEKLEEIDEKYDEEIKKISEEIAELENQEAETILKEKEQKGVVKRKDKNTKILEKQELKDMKKLLKKGKQAEVYMKMDKFRDLRDVYEEEKMKLYNIQLKRGKISKQIEEKRKALDAKMKEKEAKKEELNENRVTNKNKIQKQGLLKTTVGSIMNKWEQMKEPMSKTKTKAIETKEGIIEKAKNTWKAVIEKYDNFKNGFLEKVQSKLEAAIEKSNQEIEERKAELSEKDNEGKEQIEESGKTNDNEEKDDDIIIGE